MAMTHDELIRAQADIIVRATVILDRFSTFIADLHDAMTAEPKDTTEQAKLRHEDVVRRADRLLADIEANVKLLGDLLISTATKKKDPPDE